MFTSPGTARVGTTHGGVNGRSIATRNIHVAVARVGTIGTSGIRNIDQWGQKVASGIRNVAPVIGARSIPAVICVTVGAFSG